MISQDLYNIALKSKLIPKERLDIALKKATSIGRPFDDVLVSDGLITENYLAREIAKSLKVPFVDLDKYVIKRDVASNLPEGDSEKYRAVVFDVKKKEAYVASTNYPNSQVEARLKNKGFVKVSFFYPEKTALARAISGFRVADTQKIQALSSKSAVVALRELLDYAAYLRASDIHFEKGEKEVSVRLRVDGIMSDIVSLSSSVHAELISRIKILSNLKIDEKLRPQDGRFSHEFLGQKIDLRVSILPSNYGESAVLRLLDSGARPTSLAALGLSGKSLEIITKHLKDSHGMILSTGPTGSGKTTTLYSLLNLVSTAELKVCTIEDPVEYSLPRATQIQVNRQANLTFATGLRSLLRHDPDIMMVGEIRDPETADLAINAALTGHLVFSTLHTNDAIGFRDRLVDLDVAPFLVSSTVTVVIAQRLARKSCKKCTKKYVPSSEVIKLVEKLSGKSLGKSKFFKGEGCTFCGNSGFSGRVGIFEVMEITPKLREAIAGGMPEVGLEKILLEEGFVKMIDDGVGKAEAGQTMLEEVLRVVGKG
jgi:type IV pilus assembly protein PilB